LLVDEGLLTSEQLEAALDNQATTGRRLGEIAVEFGFVSHMALSRVLSAQYGVELKSETGFGAGLRAELERRHDKGDDSATPAPDFIVAPPALGLAPPLPSSPQDERLTDLEEELEALRQTSEYGHEEAARLSGVPVRFTKVLAYSASGLMAAIAGICQAAQEQQGDPEAGVGYELTAIAIVVIGGTTLSGDLSDIFVLSLAP